MGTKNDFVVESNGLCFVCLKGNETEGEIFTPDLNPPIRSIYSLQSLSRFLRTDMGKVFKEQDSVSQKLLTKVKKSALKVELCKGCAELVDGFSQLYQQLEKIRVRVMASLNNIHGKFLEAQENDVTGELVEFVQKRSISNSIMTGELKGKLDILDALRTEAIQKCNLKIGRTVPRIKVANLTAIQVRKEKVKLKQSPSASSSVIIPQSSTPNICNKVEPPDLQIGNIKVEDQIGNTKWDEMDDHSNYSDEFGMNDEDSTFPEVDEMKSNNGESEVPDCQLTSAWKNMQKKTPSNLNNSTINPTGLRVFKCHICSHVLKSACSLKMHLDAVHLKIKFKCMLCSKMFSQKATYVDHYKSLHKGNPDLRCPVCNRQFSRKPNLRAHQRLKNCGVGKAPINKRRVCKCKICGKGFTELGVLNRHMDEIHLRPQQLYTCNLCKRGFNRQRNLRRHKVNVHNVTN